MKFMHSSNAHSGRAGDSLGFTCTQILYVFFSGLYQTEQPFPRISRFDFGSP